MPNPKPTLARVLARSNARLVRNLNVATVGVIKSFDEATSTCSVQPGVHKLIPTPQNEDIDTVEEYPVLQNVPVIFPTFAGMAVVPPAGALVSGSPVLLVCMDRDISNWRRTGEASEPMDARLHDWSSCVAIPGLLPNVSPFTPPTDGAALGSKLDQLIGILRATPETGAATIKAAVDLAFPLVPANPGAPNLALTTTKSTILKLNS